MTEKHERAGPFACAEIAVQEPALVRLRLFSGQEFEINFSLHRFKSAKEAGDFLVKMLSSAMHDTLILANLCPHRRNTMDKIKIYILKAPEGRGYDNFTGVKCGVDFQDGRGSTSVLSDAKKLAEFRFTIEEERTVDRITGRLESSTKPA